MAKKQKGADGGLSHSVTHLLHRVLQLALDFHAEASGPTGLTQRQYTVLAAAGALSVVGVLFWRRHRAFARLGSTP